MSSDHSIVRERGPVIDDLVAGRTVLLCIQGGLGNQLFQWAFARSLQEEGMRVLLDTVRCRGDRPLMLGELTNSFEAVPRAVGLAVAAADKTGWAWKPVSSAGITRVREQGFAVDTGLRSRLGPRSVLSGYFQSPRYFSSVEGSVRTAVTAHLRGMLTPEGRRFAEDLSAKKDSVAVHVRRGDYVTSTSAASHHGALSTQYYERALAHLDSSRRRDRIWFSDDLDWVARELASPGDVLCPAGLTTAAGGEIALMAACSSRVVANSSFSWWAGFLGEGDAGNSTVIAPKTWFADGHDDAAHLVPSTWLRL